MNQTGTPLYARAWYSLYINFWTTLFPSPPTKTYPSMVTFLTLPSPSRKARIIEVLVTDSSTIYQYLNKNKTSAEVHLILFKDKSNEICYFVPIIQLAIYHLPSEAKKNLSRHVHSVLLQLHFFLFRYAIHQSTSIWPFSQHICSYVI